MDLEAVYGDCHIADVIAFIATHGSPKSQNGGFPATGIYVWGELRTDSVSARNELPFAYYWRSEAVVPDLPPNHGYCMVQTIKQPFM